MNVELAKAMPIASYTIITILFLFALWPMNEVQGQTYQETVSLHADLLSSEKYNTEVRPVKDQSKIIQVYVRFALLSIVEVNDVAQSFVSYGIIQFDWLDELLVWDPSSYGGQTVIHPLPEKIWRPRVVLVNTLEERDLFDDDKAPVFIRNGGDAMWAPGGLFPASCELKMTKYPYDKHVCSIKLAAMTLSLEELQFVTPSFKVSTHFFSTHSEWDLQEARIYVDNYSTEAVDLSGFEVRFTIERRSTFLLINIILPVIFLSFLNILVFVIPVESGQKINYGITVLLALVMFLSMVSSMLPKSSISMATVIVYLFILLILSMLSVIENILIVFLFHLDETEDNHRPCRIGESVNKQHDNATHGHVNASTPHKMNGRIEGAAHFDLLASTSGKGNNTENVNRKLKNIKYVRLGKYIDAVSFIVFFLVWFGLTLGLMATISCY